MGRSYGARSRLLWRELPGLDACGIWSALADEPMNMLAGTPVPSRAGSLGIVTDVGNDIFYGFLPETVLAWVDTALERLRPMVARLVVTGVPQSVFDLGAKRFECMRRILVPSCKLDLLEGKRRAAQLHQGLRELAERHDAVFLEFPKAWYGWDAIHVKRRHWWRVTQSLVGSEGYSTWPRIASLRVRTAAPEVRWMFRRERRTQQPAVVLGDGTRVSLY